MTTVDEFGKLVAHALAVEDDYDLDPTPAYRAVLAQVEQHPEARLHHGSALLATLEAGGDGGLFMFCMEKLKWPEVEAELRKRFVASANPRNMRPHFFYASCLRCFDENPDLG